MRLVPRAEVRVTVYDNRGSPVRQLAFPSHSFTFNFANVFLAEIFGSPSYFVPPSPAFVITDVNGVLYTIGYTYQNPVGQLSLPMCLVGCPGLSPYASSVINSPGIWAGYVQCPQTNAAIAPCSPVPSSVLSPAPLYVPYVVASGPSGFQYTVTQSLYNVSGSTVSVGSLALVAAMYGTLSSSAVLYSVLVDNVNPTLSLPANYYITVTYTITLPT